MGGWGRPQGGPDLHPVPLAYLYSRYPVVSQTFCDSEMLALESMGVPLLVGSLNPPPTSFRHDRLRALKAEIAYPPPSDVLKALPLPPAIAALAEEHAKRYPAFKIERARNAAWFSRVFAAAGVKHIHVHFANQATWTALFLKKAGFTFSFTAHAQDFMVDLGSRDLLREMAAEAQAVVAVSDYSAGLLRQICPESAEKINRIYNGIWPHEFPSAAVEPAAGSPGRPLRLISVGRLIEFKGFHHLIEALRIVKGRGLAVRQLIIGDGPWRERLQRQIDDADMENDILLAGPQDLETIKRELSVSDIFALACCVDQQGASDILPTVIMEAMAVGLPVVSTRLVGVPEMVGHEKTGLLVPPGDAPALAGAIERLARDPALRQAMGEAAREECGRKFSLSVTGQQVAMLFRGLGALPVGPRPGPPPNSVVLVDDWPEDPSAKAELGRFLDAPGVVTLVAAPGGENREAAGDLVQYLPDALVLEASWRANPSAVALCEALYRKLPGVDGEEFFRQARRAVHTAAWIRQRGLRQVHASRSRTVLWTWLTARIASASASAVIEPSPAVSRTLLAALAPDFAWTACGDAKLEATLREKGKCTIFSFAAQEAKRGLFKKTPPIPDFVSVVAQRLQRL